MTTRRAMATRPGLYAGLASVAGAMCLAILWIVEMRVHGLGIVGIHERSAALWVADTLPLIMGVAAWQIAQSAQDRAERDVAERDLHAAEKGWSGSALAQALVEGVLLVDPDGTIVRGNHAAQVIFDARNGLEGLKLEQLLPDHADLDAASTVQRHAGGTVIGTEWAQRAQRLDGNTFGVEVTAGPSTHGRALLIIRPEVERISIDPKWKEELANARAARDAAVKQNQSKSRFLAEMSHELRTPLNAIIGYAELAAEEAEQEDVVADLDRISSAGHHLLRLINDVLDLSKIESGTMSVLLEPAAVSAVLSDVKRTLEPLAAKGNNRLVIDLEGNLPRARIDSMRLRQAVINIAGNACKFTQDGSITLAAQYDESKALPGVLIRIRDTGSGMTEEQVQAAFQPFVQVGDRTSRRKGTGLGLALASRFVEMMGGEITASSEVGVGTEFRIWVTAEQTDPSTGDDSMDLAAPALRTLLVVDRDDERLRKMTSRRLEARGFDVRFADVTGENLTRAVDRLEPVAVLIDPADLESVRELAATLVPVIVTSADFDLEPALAAGARHYLPKPLDWDALTMMLDHPL